MKGVLILMMLLLSAGSAANARITAKQMDSLPVEPNMQALADQFLGMHGLRNEVRVVIDPSARGCAYAQTVEGKQYIGADLACTGPLYTNGVLNYRAAAAVAHEVGHLLSGHTTNGTHSHREELEADAWAGWALYRLGASLEEAQTFHRTVSPKGSESHPGREARLAAVAKGWQAAHGNAVHPPPLPVSDPPPTLWARLLQTRLPWAR